ncbi:MAG: methyltransferase [bacterium]|nr:methyltransferase [bacterium]
MDDLIIKTDARLFSPNKIDEGSQFLLDSIIFGDNDKDILDFGCGWGAIGIEIAKTHTDINVRLTDIDDLALKISEENLIDNKLENAKVITLKLIQENSFDVIISNLPWHKNISSIPKMIDQAFSWLKIGGKFYVVISKEYRSEDLLTKIFGNAVIVSENETYKVILAKKLSEKVDLMSEYKDKINTEINLKNGETLLEIFPPWNLISQNLRTTSYDKIFGIIPLDFCEPLMYKLAHIKKCEIFLVLPERYTKKLLMRKTFTDVFNIKVLFEIPRYCFSPMPPKSSLFIFVQKK